MNYLGSIRNHLTVPVQYPYTHTYSPYYTPFTHYSPILLSQPHWSYQQTLPQHVHLLTNNIAPPVHTLTHTHLQYPDEPLHEENYQGEDTVAKMGGYKKKKKKKKQPKVVHLTDCHDHEHCDEHDQHEISFTKPHDYDYDDHHGDYGLGHYDFHNDHHFDDHGYDYDYHDDHADYHDDDHSYHGDYHSDYHDDHKIIGSKHKVYKPKIVVIKKIISDSTTTLPPPPPP